MAIHIITIPAFISNTPGAGCDVTAYPERTFDQHALWPDRVGMSQKHDRGISFAGETDQHVVATFLFGNASGFAAKFSKYIR